MFVGFRFVTFCSAITFFLPSITIGTAKFKTTPKDEVRFVGEDIVLNWTYNASSKDTEFKTYSPKWYYYDANGTLYQLAREDQSKGWAWEIVTASCPRRLLYPVQRIFKFESGEQYSAALKITNLTLADSGTYECQLRMLSRTLIDKMNLTVKVPPPVTTAPSTASPSTGPSSPQTTEGPTTGPSPPQPTEGSTAVPLNKTCEGHFNISNNEELAKDEKKPFKELKAKIHNLFPSVYQSSFISLDKTEFREEGSVIIVYFEVTLYNVSEPFAILKKAVKDSGGILHGLKIDPDSIQSGTCTPSIEDSSATPPCGLGTGEIIGIVIGVLAVIIVIVVIVVWLVKRSNNKGDIGSNKSKDVATDDKLTEDGKNAIHPV